MLIGKDGSKEILAEVERSIFNTNKILPLKRIQFYKTQLYISIGDLRKNNKIDVDMMREVIRNGISLVKLYVYERHAREISLLGNMIEGKERVKSGINVKIPDYCLK